jgi:ABC-type multidrug transport system fused ATPase/permease subunit
MNAVEVPEQQASVARGLRRLRRLSVYVRRSTRRVVIGLAAMLVATGAALAAPYLAKVAIDSAIVPQDLTALAYIVAAYLVILIVGFGAQGIQTYEIGYAGERILTDLRGDLFGHLQGLELGFYERNRAGVLISRLTNDIEALQQLVTDGLTSTVQSTLTLVGSTVILFWLDWRLALATIVVFPLMAVATALFRNYSARAYRRMRERLGLVTATLQEDLSGVRVLQAYSREDTNLARFRSVNGSYRDANQQTVYANAYYFPAVGLLSNIGTVIVFGYGGYLYIQDDLALGTLVAFTGYLTNFFDPVQQLSQLYNTFLAASAALDKIFDVMDVQPQLVDRADAEDIEIDGAVDFEDVRFGYRADREVLHGLTLHADAGQTVALVGHTGAGKSTIVKLLARFYDPTSGSIRIDGRDLRDVSRASLRRQIGIVPQEGFLFASTIRENIAYGRPDATDEEVRAAAEAVGAAAFIEALPLGYDTPVQERGVRLSIGQRQLVALARALLHDPRLLILDEATSSVDLATEERIEEAIATVLGGRTSFVVAHRLSTIRRADLIVVLEHGVVVEQGCHDELLERGGRYRSLYGDWLEAASA